MWLAYIVLFVIAAACTWYLHKILGHGLAAFSVSSDRTWVRALLWVTAGVMGLCLLDISSIGFMLVIHFLFFSALAQLLARMVKRWSVAARILNCGLIPLVLAVSLVIYGYVNMYQVVCTAYTLKTEKNIHPEGYRVALVADVHFGVTLDADELLKVCDEIESQKPDAVILCGDIVDNETSREDMQTVFSVFGTIESTYGSFYVYGNHDRAMGHLQMAYTDDELEVAIESAGITVLKDQAVCLDTGLYLVGRDDPGFGGKGGRATAEALLADIPENAYCIVANHQPADYEATGKAGADLILSGHTHGGQIWPANWIDSLFGINDANYGLVEVDEDTKAIVTSGLAGWGFPIKTSAPSEYVIVDIVP